MSVKSFALYESWDLTKEQLPKRSHLYSLKPIGFATSSVESFTSYLQRLAAAHCISTACLIRYKIAPLFLLDDQPPEELTADAFKMIMDAWHRQPAMLQQQEAKFWLDRTPSVSKLVGILEKLTTRLDLRFGTLLPCYSWRLNFNQIFHTEQLWCPACYQDWRENSLPIYHPLLWAINAVTVCPVHQHYLQLRCLYCGCFQQFLNLDCHSLGYCSTCNAWLGRFVDHTTKSVASPFHWDLWVAQSVDQIIAAVPTLSFTPFPQNLPSAKYRHKPTLIAFLKSCSRIGINPLEGLKLLKIIPNVLT